VGPPILPVALRAPQPPLTRFGLSRDAAEFVGDLQRALNLVLRRVVGPFRALGQLARALEPHRQLVLDAIRDAVMLPGPHRSVVINFKMAATRTELPRTGKIAARNGDSDARAMDSTTRVGSNRRHTRGRILQRKLTRSVALHTDEARLREV